MSKKRTLYGLLAAIVTIGGLSAYWMTSRDDRALSAGSTKRADGAATERAEGDAIGDANEQGKAEDTDARKSLAAATSTAPLPPLNAPLRTIVRALVERADNGDLRAKCRLAAEYEYCTGLEIRMKMIESGVERAQSAAQNGRGGRFGGPERIAEIFDSTSEQYAHCEGVDVPPTADVVRYMREAAVGGHAKAASYYATGEMFHPRDMLDALSELSLYRDQAERLANEAVAQGDLRAAWALADAYASDPDDPRRSLLAQAVKPSPEKALSLLYGLRTSANTVATNAEAETSGRFDNRLRDRIASLEQRLPPEVVQRARSEPAPIGAKSGGIALDQALPGGGFMRGRGDFPRDFCD